MYKVYHIAIDHHGIFIYFPLYMYVACKLPLKIDLIIQNMG